MFCKGLYNKLYDIDTTVRFERVTDCLLSSRVDERTNMRDCSPVERQKIARKHLSS